LRTVAFPLFAILDFSLAFLDKYAATMPRTAWRFALEYLDKK
jgi:hypothetical protein